jgi:hypothetical protein
VKAAVLKPFLLGFTVGVGMTALSLYTGRPGIIGTSLERLSERGRLRRAEEEEKERERDWLRAAGFSDEEIEEAN